MLVRPGFPEAGDARRGQPARIRAEQSRECVLKVAAGEAPEIQDRDQNFEALRAPGVGRQDRGCEPDAPLTGPPAVANPWRTHANRPKAGDDLALGSVAVAHQPLAAILGVLVGVAGEEGCDLRLDGLRQQRSRTLAQNFGERVGESSWLDQPNDSILGHGVSLLGWRSGGLEHPHDTPPHPLTPSPTSAHTSILVVTGKSYGVTNLIALDGAGGLLAESLISVQGATEALVTVLRDKERDVERQTYACTPTCQPTLQLGDDAKYFSEVQGQTGQRNTLATAR